MTLLCSFQKGTVIALQQGMIVRLTGKTGCGVWVWSLWLLNETSENMIFSGKVVM